MRKQTQRNAISEEDAFTEITSLQPAADRVRFAALHLTGAFSAARKKSLLRQENAAVARYGPASPEAADLRRRLQVEERFAVAVRAEAQRGEVELVPRNPKALILRGRVVDARRLGLPELTVSAVDTRGKPAASTVSSATGYFECQIPVKNPEAPEKVSLLVSDSARNILYRGCECHEVRGDAVVTRELMLGAAEPIPQPTPPPDIDPKRVTVPDVRGLRQNDAERQLTALCLKPAVVTKETSADNVGRILDQDPDPGSSVPLASTVTLALGVATTTVKVPDLVGLSQDEATAQLKTVGLAVGSVGFEPTETERVGIILRQSPVPGAQVAPGSPVNLVVGTEVDRVRVPNLRNRSLKEARETLAKSRLIVGRVEPARASDDSVVVQQKPAARSQATEGTAVDLEVRPATGGDPRPAAPKRTVAKKKAARKAATKRAAQASDHEGASR